MWLQTVLTAASSFFLPNHFSTLMVFLSTMKMSTARWRNSFFRVPRGPCSVKRGGSELGSYHCFWDCRELCKNIPGFLPSFENRSKNVRLPLVPWRNISAIQSDNLAGMCLQYFVVDFHPPLSDQGMVLPGSSNLAICAS